MYKQHMDLYVLFGNFYSLNISDLLFRDMIIFSKKVGMISWGSVTLMDAPIATTTKILLVTTLCPNVPKATLYLTKMHFCTFIAKGTIDTAFDKALHFIDSSFPWSEYMECIHMIVCGWKNPI